MSEEKQEFKDCGHEVEYKCCCKIKSEAEFRYDLVTEIKREHNKYGKKYE